MEKHSTLIAITPLMLLIASGLARAESGAGTMSNPSQPRHRDLPTFAGTAAIPGSGMAQQAYLKASNADPDDMLGYSIAMSGDTLVVGAPQEGGNGNGPDNTNNRPRSGAAYVFVRKAGGWQQQAYLKGDNAAANGLFGASVALSGNTIAIGAPNHGDHAGGVLGRAVYVFSRTGEVWEQEAYLGGRWQQLYGWFGLSVALSGDTLLVGAPAENRDGITLLSTTSPGRCTRYSRVSNALVVNASGSFPGPMT